MQTPIIILSILIFPLLVAFVISKFTRHKLDAHKFACWGLGVAFIYFFIGHLIQTDGMVDMLPVWLPMRLELIYLTGVLELAIGIALFIPKYQQTAAKLAIVVFVAFFPANIYAALNSVGMGGHQWGQTRLIQSDPIDSEFGRTAKTSAVGFKAWRAAPYRSWLHLSLGFITRSTDR